jgi:Cys-rich protein (TIGR01571 family)
MASPVAPLGIAYPPPPAQDAVAVAVEPAVQQVETVVRQVETFYPPPTAEQNAPAAVTSAGPVPRTGPVYWETGLLSCCSGPNCCSNFWCSIFCPCCLYGKNYEKMDLGGKCGGCCLFFLLGLLCMDGCVMGTKLRGKLEQEHGVKHSCWGATCAYMCCMPCALCQDSREIDRRQSKEQFVAGAHNTAPAAQEMAH